MTDIFDADPDAFVEPWTPRVGDRVRIGRLAECRAKLAVWSQGAAVGLVDRHLAAEDGLTGTVSTHPRDDEETLAYRRSIGHSYVVIYDQPVFVAGELWSGGGFAACELELLP